MIQEPSTSATDQERLVDALQAELCNPHADLTQVKLDPNVIADLEKHASKLAANLDRILLELKGSMHGVGFLFFVCFCAGWVFLGRGGVG